MSAEDKVKLIGKMIDDFWGYSTDEDLKHGATVLIAAIATVADFGQEVD